MELTEKLQKLLAIGAITNEEYGILLRRMNEDSFEAKYKRAFEDFKSETLEYFKWERVEKAMSALGWVWQCNTSTPTVQELKDWAIKLMDELYECVKDWDADDAKAHGYYNIITSGGFQAEVWIDEENRLNDAWKLTFYIDEWNSYE